MPTRDEQHKEQYRTIYEELDKLPRIYIKELSKVLGVNSHAGSKRLKEAFEKGYIMLPQIRKRSYKNMEEYMYFVNCKNPLRAFKQYKNNMDVVYHAVMGGFANLWLITKKEIDIDGDIVFCGRRSDYYIAFAPNRSWERAIQNMWNVVKTFDRETYECKGIITTHWDELLPWWDAEFEILAREFKYDLRRTLTPIIRKNLISTTKIYEFMEKIHECCTVFTRYFPETIESYDPYLFMFETDYEDFVIDVFSQLPTSSFFFRVSDRLFLYAHVEKASLRNTGLDMSDVSQLHIPLLADALLERGIIESEAHAILEYHYRKDI